MMIKRLMAFFIALATALTVQSAWSMSAFAAEYNGSYWELYDRLVEQGDTYNYTSGIGVGYSSSVRYVNNGVVNVTGSFDMYVSSVFENNGTLNYSGFSAFSLGSGSASLINKGTVTIDGTMAFIVQDNTRFENNGTLYLNADSVTLDGFINNGTVVIPDSKKDSGIHNSLKGKNSDTGRIYTKTEYEQLSIDYNITYEGLSCGGHSDVTNNNVDKYTWSAAAPQIVTVNDPILPGYEFLGWTGLDVDKPAKNFTFPSSVCKDVTLTAHWMPAVYTISYDLDGGSFYVGNTPNTEYSRGEQPGLIIPYKSGYTFAGWIDTDTGEQVGTGDTIYYQPPTMIGNKTYKARFIANTDTKYNVVCYYQNIDGTYEEAAYLLTGETGAEVSASSEDYAKEHFTFDADNSFLSGAIKADNSLELKLYFNRDKYTVTFKSQDGSETLWTTEKYYNEKVGAYGGEIPTKASDDELYTYVFNNWSREEPNRDFGYDASGVVVSENITFYAAFEKVRDESVVVITWEEYEGFNAPAQTEIRLAKGTDYTAELQLINENYFVGTPVWSMSFKEAHIYWYDTQSGEHGVEYTIAKDNFEAPVTLTIPDIQHDTIIKVMAHYHEEHDYSDAYDEIIVDGKCREESVIRHFCYKCGKTEDETILPYDHAPSDHYTTDKLSHWKVCTICGERIGVEAHAPGESRITQIPTHSTTGTASRFCTVCGIITDSETLPMIPHAPEGDWQSGEDTHYRLCSCGEKLDAAPHIPDEGTVTLEPTYDAEGKTEYRCKVCGYLIGETAIAPLGHNVDEEWQSEASGHWHNCECGERHSFGEHISDGGTITVEPAYDARGEEVFKCKVCGYVLSTHTIPPLSHKTDGEWVSDDKEHWQDGCGCGERHELAAHIPDSGTVTLYPTETEEGIMEYRCKVCGYIIRTEPVPVLGNKPETPSKPIIPVIPEKPTEPSTSDEPETPLLPDNNVPFIKGENGKNGWEVIAGEIDKSDDGSTVTVDMNGAAVVPGNIIDTFKGKDVTVVFDMGEGITWSVHGKDIVSENNSDIDLSVKQNTVNIPVDVINNITGERYSIQISLAHNGDFGFTAVLSINLERGNAGQKAALYYYDGGALELMSESEISADGTARFTYAHASDYLIVIGEKNSSADIEEQPDNSKDENPSTGAAVSPMPLIAVTAAMIVTAKRKKN